MLDHRLVCRCRCNIGRYVTAVSFSVQPLPRAPLACGGLFWMFVGIVLTFFVI